MFRMQMKLGHNEPWIDIRPSGKLAKPYEYETREEAERMLRICYPEVERNFFAEDGFQVRVKEVKT